MITRWYISVLKARKNSLIDSYCVANKIWIYHILDSSGITRELIEIRDQRVVDVQFGGYDDYVVILTAGEYTKSNMMCTQFRFIYTCCPYIAYS